MIEVFKTNVDCRECATNITKELKILYAFDKVTFDFHDVDRVLRIEAATITNRSVIIHLKKRGYWCKEMEG